MKRETGRKLGITALGLLLVAPILGAGFFLRSRDRLHRATVEMKALGYPVTKAELLAMAPPESENAEKIYNGLFAELDRLKLIGEMSSATDYDQPISPDQIKLLDANPDFVRKLKRLREKPKVWFHDLATKGYDSTGLRMPSVGPQDNIDDVRDWLNAKILLDAKRGQFAGALDHLDLYDLATRQLADAPYAHHEAELFGWQRQRLVWGAIAVSKDLEFANAVRKRTAAAPYVDFNRMEIAVNVAEINSGTQHELINGLAFGSFEFFTSDGCVIETINPFRALMWHIPGALEHNRATLMEANLRAARFGEDGLSSEEQKDLEQRSEMARRDPSLWVYLPGATITGGEASYRKLVLLGIDLMIEDLGGDKVILPAGFQRKTGKNGWVVWNKEKRLTADKFEGVLIDDTPPNFP